MTIVFDRAQLCAMDIHEVLFVSSMSTVMLTSNPPQMRTTFVLVAVCALCRKGL